ncbi:MAG: tetratricopeptide repeat protein [Opitutaceae bacterium]
MKPIVLIFIGAALLVSGVGCGRKTSASKKEITSLQRKEAATLVAEAEFAMNVRDLARAEKLLTKVVELSPDIGDYWIGLGSVRKRLGDRDGAKRAYQSALEGQEEAAKADKKNTAALLEQVRILALLGRVDDARKALEKAQKNFPEDSAIRTYIKERELDDMLADPTFKDIAL